MKGYIMANYENRILAKSKMQKSKLKNSAARPQWRLRDFFAMAFNTPQWQKKRRRLLAINGIFEKHCALLHYDNAPRRYASRD